MFHINKNAGHNLTISDSYVDSQSVSSNAGKVIYTNKKEISDFNDFHHFKIENCSIESISKFSDEPNPHKKYLMYRRR